MNTKRKHEIFEKATLAWGVDAQVLMAIEEMAELTKELCKLKRKNYSYTNITIQSLIEEIADVRLMVDQVAYMFDIRGKDMYDFKLNKIAEKLSNDSTQSAK